MTPLSSSDDHPLVLDGTLVTLTDVLEVVDGCRKVILSGDPEVRQRLMASVHMVRERVENGTSLYGVTTGVGDSVDRVVEGDACLEMPRLLARMHGCGLGEDFSPRECRAILLARILPLARGASGIRPEVLDTLCEWLNEDVVPRIPQEGSVGASGDLTPLSYIAACLMGEREMWKDGQRVPAAEVWRAQGKTPFVLGPKETLGIMNGTSAMTGLACLHLAQAEYLASHSCTLTGLGVVALQGNPDHTHPRLMEFKPHPGQERAASGIRQVFEEDTTAVGSREDRLQDPYSFRCAPQVIGVLWDALPWMRSQLETELNGVNDNPVLDPEHHMAYHGGHFYGGHVGFIEDSLKTLLANVIDLLDRQMAVLVDPKTSQGLPANLSASGRSVHHGLKALQVAQSSFAAEAQKLCMPASVFSRSTECHNQDKVSMGLHAARDVSRMLELFHQVLACQTVTVRQALELRERLGFHRLHLSPEGKRWRQAVSSLCPFLEEDTELEAILRGIVRVLEQRALSLEI